MLPTVQGQATGLRTVMDCLAKIPGGRGLGSFYWEPDWYAVPGAGWKNGEGNNWENLAMFDEHGKALDSWDVYKDVADQSLPTIAPTVTSIEPVKLAGGTGVPVKLPPTVYVTFSDDHTEDLAVTWEQDAPVFDAAGSYTVHGTVAGLDETVDASITIAQGANLLQNGDFDTMTMTGWTVDGAAGALDMKSGKGDALGAGALHYWLGTPFHFTVHQTVTGLPDGRYTAEVSTQGKGDAVSYKLVVTSGDVEKSADIKDSGWNVWSTTRVKDIEVRGGTATVAIDLTGKADDWGSIDNVKFYRQD